MANPQKENGHIDIANEIVEQLARVNLSAYEWRVVWCILRKTWGWQKRMDRVAVSQIVNMTGLRKQHASRARLSLVEKKILVEKDDKVGFNKDYDTWTIKRVSVTNSGDETVTDRGDGVTNSGESVTNRGDKTSPVEEPQKKRKTINKREGEPKRKPRFKKPTPTEVKAYADSIDYHTLDAEYFVDSYESKGWMIGKSPMKDWKAVVRTWKSRDEKNGKPTGGPQRGDPDWLPTEEEAEALMAEVEA
ncbi:MAG: replication protein [Phycisphaerae bacterium]|nr:replication protein [Phycisphaerae bacterium]